jgi:hypothetical protein
MMEFEQHPTKPNTLVIKMPKHYIAKHSDEDLRAAVLAEREACAKLCEDEYKLRLAETIRARGTE